MATEQTLTTLIINKVDSKETFNKMKAQGLVNENELYLTPEGAATDQQIKVQNNEPANAVANDLWLDLDEDAPAIGIASPVKTNLTVPPLLITSPISEKLVGFQLIAVIFIESPSYVPVKVRLDLST